MAVVEILLNFMLNTANAKTTVPVKTCNLFKHNNCTSSNVTVTDTFVSLLWNISVQILNFKIRNFLDHCPQC